MSGLELDIAPHTIETSLKSNRKLVPYVLNSHSVTLVATLAFPIFYSHFEANTKCCMLAAPLYRPWTVTILSQQNSSNFHEGVSAVFVTQFIILYSSFMILDICGESGFVGNTTEDTDRKIFRNYLHHLPCSFLQHSLSRTLEPLESTWFQIETLEWTICKGLPTI